MNANFFHLQHERRGIIGFFKTSSSLGFGVWGLLMILFTELFTLHSPLSTFLPFSLRLKGEERFIEPLNTSNFVLLTSFFHSPNLLFPQIIAD